MVSVIVTIPAGKMRENVVEPKRLRKEFNGHMAWATAEGFVFLPAVKVQTLD